MYDKGKLIKLHYIYRYVKQRTAQFENPAIFYLCTYLYIDIILDTYLHIQYLNKGSLDICTVCKFSNDNFQALSMTLPSKQIELYLPRIPTHTIWPRRLGQTSLSKN